MTSTTLPQRKSLERRDILTLAQVAAVLALLSWASPQIFQFATLAIVLAIPFTAAFKTLRWSPRWTTIFTAACVLVAPFYALGAQAAILAATEAAFTTAVTSLGGGVITPDVAAGIFSFIRVAIFIGLIGGVATAAIQFFSTGQYQQVLTITIGAGVVIGLIEAVSTIIFV